MSPPDFWIMTMMVGWTFFFWTTGEIIFFYAIVEIGKANQSSSSIDPLKVRGLFGLADLTKDLYAEFIKIN